MTSSPAVLEAVLACPDGTPYEGGHLALEVTAASGYPFRPPAVKFKQRVSHLSSRWIVVRDEYTRNPRELATLSSKRPVGITRNDEACLLLLKKCSPDMNPKHLPYVLEEDRALWS